MIMTELIEVEIVLFIRVGRTSPGLIVQSAPDMREDQLLGAAWAMRAPWRARGSRRRRRLAGCGFWAHRRRGQPYELSAGKSTQRRSRWLW
jgi:hypothetical protein